MSTAGAWKSLVCGAGMGLSASGAQAVVTVVSGCHTVSGRQAISACWKTQGRVIAVVNACREVSGLQVAIVDTYREVSDMQEVIVNACRVVSGNTGRRPRSLP